MKLTAAQLAQAMDTTLMRASLWLDSINQTLATFNINTERRVAMFLAQLAHESGRLAYVREIWGPTPAQQRYEGRKDLGNTQPGDGKRYMGRGLIQLTGRSNYAQITAGMRRKFPDSPDFESDPEKLEQRPWAALSAGWFWETRNLNAVADKGDLLQATRIINGGTNGLADREALYKRAKKALL